MNNLQERVQKMLEGETKRRDVALSWISEIEGILLPISEDIWSAGDDFGSGPTYTVTLTKNDKENKKKDTCIYFRYKNYESTDTECIGFYDNSFTNCNRWGKSVENLKGQEFWYAVQVIMGWIPQLIEVMDEREEIRNDLLAKIL